EDDQAVDVDWLEEVAQQCSLHTDHIPQGQLVGAGHEGEPLGGGDDRVPGGDVVGRHRKGGAGLFHLHLQPALSSGFPLDSTLLVQFCGKDSRITTGLCVGEQVQAQVPLQANSSAVWDRFQDEVVITVLQSIVEQCLQVLVEHTQQSSTGQ